MERNANRLLYKHKVLQRKKQAKAPVEEKKEADDELDDLAREFNSEAQPKSKDDDGDSSDEFGVFDPEKHVSFDEKVRFSEQLKKCSRNKLTKIVQVL